MNNKISVSFRLMVVIILTVPLRAVTVNPALCPTNKIAPHRRIRNAYQGRTLGAFYNLLTPAGFGPGPGNQLYDPNLQEEPQRDDPEDCGDIEDYDENDLSSLTPQYPRRQGYGDSSNSRLFFGLFEESPHGPLPQRPPYPGQPPYQPQRPPQRPPQPQRPPPGSSAPNRPMYGSGGYFENNPYRPPTHHYPSDDIKPVHDGNVEPQTTYRPHVVGGPIGHIVGVTPAAINTPRPTRRPNPRPLPDPQNYTPYPPRPTPRPAYTTRRPRNRNFSNNDSILGSFFDLLF